MNKTVPFLLALLVMLTVACKPSAPDLPEPPQERLFQAQSDDSTAPAPSIADLKKAAETRIFPAMKPDLVEFVRGQEWFTEVTAAEYLMLETLRDTEKAAQRHGTDVVFMDSLRLTTEQWWLQDGFDDNEAKAMTAIYRAYQSSLADRYVPKLGPLLASSIRGNYFHVLNLPESGEVTIVISTDAQLEHLAPKAMELAVANLATVESIVGPFPYPFVYIWVTDLGGDGLLGMNRNEFIWIGADAVETNTMAHEMTHATLYGNFPIWFEEGFAYYVGSYANNELKTQEQDSLYALSVTKRPRKLDLGAKFDHSAPGYFSTISQGFLFFQGLSDILSLEGLTQVVRSLRSKTYTNDNELLRAIVANSAPEMQAAVQQYLCNSVIGLRSGCQ